jgi:hypothetical protein
MDRITDVALDVGDVAFRVLVGEDSLHEAQVRLRGRRIPFRRGANTPPPPRRNAMARPM